MILEVQKQRIQLKKDMTVILIRNSWLVISVTELANHAVELSAVLTSTVE